MQCILVHYFSSYFLSKTLKKISLSFLSGAQRCISKVCELRDHVWMVSHPEMAYRASNPIQNYYVPLDQPFSSFFSSRHTDKLSWHTYQVLFTCIKLIIKLIPYN